MDKQTTLQVQEKPRGWKHRKVYFVLAAVLGIMIALAVFPVFSQDLQAEYTTKVIEPVKTSANTACFEIRKILVKKIAGAKELGLPTEELVAKYNLLKDPKSCYNHVADLLSGMSGK